MADNFPLTPGSGRNAATDQVSYSGDTADVQLVRPVLVTGAESSKTVVDLPGDSSNGLDVDVTRLPALVASSAYIGNVGRIQKNVSVAFNRPADTTTYAAGDAVANSTSAPSVLTFDAVGRANGGSGVIIGATLVSSANPTLKGMFELFLFDTTFTPDNDNAVITPTDAELLTCIGTIQFFLPTIGDAAAGASGNVLYQASGLYIPFTCGGSSDDIFGQLCARNAYVPVSGETFTIRLTVNQN